MNGEWQDEWWLGYAKSSLGRDIIFLTFGRNSPQSRRYNSSSRHYLMSTRYCTRAS